MTDRAWVGQYLVYCGWLSFELCFVLMMIVETKGLQHNLTQALARRS